MPGREIKFGKKKKKKTRVLPHGLIHLHSASPVASEVVHSGAVVGAGRGQPVGTGPGVAAPPLSSSVVRNMPSEGSSHGKQARVTTQRLFRLLIFNLELLQEAESNLNLCPPCSKINHL